MMKANPTLTRSSVLLSGYHHDINVTAAAALKKIYMEGSSLNQEPS
jgi:hypothetical protein